MRALYAAGVIIAVYLAWSFGRWQEKVWNFARSTEPQDKPAKLSSRVLRDVEEVVGNFS